MTAHTSMTAYPVQMDIKPEVQAFFDEATNTISYIVKDPSSNACAIVDSVMDIDYAAGRITYEHADELIRQIEIQGLKLEWIIETHVHADHLSAAPYIQEKLGGKIGIGSKIMIVQDTFGKVFNEGTEFQRDGSQFDALFKQGDSFHIGQMRGDVLHTPGHTPGSTSYLVDGKFLISGDTVFIRSIGRPDLGGMVKEWSQMLFNTMTQKIRPLDDGIIALPGHYMDWKEADGRLAFMASMGQIKADNSNIYGIEDENEFFKFIKENMRAQPEEYAKIREINAGLREVDAEEQDILDLGKNECAASAQPPR